MKKVKGSVPKRQCPPPPPDKDCFTLEADIPENGATGEKLKAIFRFLRRYSFCLLGMHRCTITDITTEHNCPDCGEHFEAITWPRAPEKVVMDDCGSPPDDEDETETVHSLNLRILKARAELLENEVRKLHECGGPCTR